MSVRGMSVITVVAWTLVVGGCAQFHNPLVRHKPIPTFEERYDETLGVFTHMADNALLRNMSIADFHFIPHTSELSGTGVVRLDRLAKLLDVYGGTVRYATYEMDEELLAQRLEHVREYIAAQDCDMDRVQVALMQMGGGGMRASQAMAIRTAGTADKGGSRGGFAPASGGG